MPKYKKPKHGAKKLKSRATRLDTASSIDKKKKPEYKSSSQKIKSNRASSVRKSSKHQIPETQKEQGKVLKLPLWIKFSCATVATTFIACLCLTFFAYKITASRAVNSLDESSIRMMKVLSSFDIAFWKAAAKANDSQNPLSEFEEYFEKQKSFEKRIKAIDIAPVEGEEGKKIKSKLENYAKLVKSFKYLNEDLLDMLQGTSITNPLKAIEGDESLLRDINTPNIINIVISDKDNNAIVYKNAAGPVIELDQRNPLGEKDHTQIQEGFYLAGTNRIYARYYKRTLLDKSGKSNGIIHMWIMADEINGLKRELMSWLIMLLVVFVILGGGIGIILSSVVIKPINQLISDMDIVSSGNLDYETLATSNDEIGVLADTFNKMTRSLKDAHETELANRALEHELSIANDVQANLLPKKLPKVLGYDIAAYYRPTKEVGGDYYDFIQIDNRRLGIVMADVSGKGIPGSMVMTMARGMLRMQAEKNTSTSDTLIKVNKILASDIKPGMFVTCLYAIWDVIKHELLVSSAGHNPLLHVKGNDASYDLINPNGIALGFDKGPIFEKTIKEQVIKIEPGDRFVFFTDGVTESMNAIREQFGEKRLYDLCVNLNAKDSNLFLSNIINELDNHKGDAPQHDDITLCTIRKLPM